MKERPILFSGEMVKAILDGRKTQTRRILKPGKSQDWLTSEVINNVKHWEPGDNGWWRMTVGQPCRIIHCGIEIKRGHIGSIHCPYGVPGDRLWVRESWAIETSWPDDNGSGNDILYKATDCDPDSVKWRSSRYMPRWASRIDLEIVNIRVERLQDISMDDAIAEGVEPEIPPFDTWLCEAQSCAAIGFPICSNEIVHCYRRLWESINGRSSWDANPYVWVIEFKKVSK